jgi:hypothetical protein
MWFERIARIDSLALLRLIGWLGKNRTSYWTDHNFGSSCKSIIRVRRWFWIRRRLVMANNLNRSSIRHSMTFGSNFNPGFWIRQDTMAFAVQSCPWGTIRRAGFGFHFWMYIFDILCCLTRAYFCWDISRGFLVLTSDGCVDLVPSDFIFWPVISIDTRSPWLQLCVECSLIQGVLQFIFFFCLHSIYWAFCLLLQFLFRAIYTQ